MVPGRKNPRNSPIALRAGNSTEAGAGETFIEGEHADDAFSGGRLPGSGYRLPFACGQAVAVITMAGPPAPQGETCLTFVTMCLANHPRSLRTFFLTVGLRSSLGEAQLHQMLGRAEHIGPVADLDDQAGIERQPAQLFEDGTPRHGAVANCPVPVCEPVRVL